MRVRFQNVKWMCLAAGLCIAGRAMAGPISPAEPSQSADPLRVIPSGIDGGASQEPGIVPRAPPAAARLAPGRNRVGSSADGAAAILDAPPGVDTDRAVIPTLSAGSGGRAGAAMPLDENPTVELADVIRSVARTAVQSVPWVRTHFPQRHNDSASRNPGSAGDASQDPAVRAQYDLYGPGGRGGAQGDAGATSGGSAARGQRVNLLQDAVQLVRDVIGHPITWLLVVLLVIGSLTASMARGRGK